LREERRPPLREERRPPLRVERRPPNCRLPLHVEWDPELLEFAGIPAVIEFGIPCGVIPPGTTLARANPPLIFLFGIIV